MVRKYNTIISNLKYHALYHLREYLAPSKVWATIRYTPKYDYYVPDGDKIKVLVANLKNGIWQYATRKNGVPTKFLLYALQDGVLINTWYIPAEMINNKYKFDIHESNVEAWDKFCIHKGEIPWDVLTVKFDRNISLPKEQ
jgi:hypothetical protein